MKPVLVWILRLGLGGLFLLTGILKVGNPSAFATEIHNYQLLPGLAPLLAASLPTVEIVAGLAMVLGTRKWARAGALAASAMLVLFTVAVTWVVFRGINVSCGCFGEGSGTVTVLTVVRDLALLAASFSLVWLSGDPNRPVPAPALA